MANVASEHLGRAMTCSHLLLLPPCWLQQVLIPVPKGKHISGGSGWGMEHCYSFPSSLPFSLWTTRQVRDHPTAECGLLDTAQWAWKLCVYLMGTFRVAKHPIGPNENCSIDLHRSPRYCNTQCKCTITFCKSGQTPKALKLAEHKVPWFFSWLSAFPADWSKKYR